VRAIVALSLLALAAALVWDRLPRRGAYEVLLGRVPDRLYVRGKRAYIVETGPPMVPMSDHAGDLSSGDASNAVTVTALPLEGGNGQPQTVRRRLPDWHPRLDRSDTTVSDDEILCFITPPETGVGVFPGSSPPTAPKNRVPDPIVSGITLAEWKASWRRPNLGDYLPGPSHSAAPGERRFTVVDDRSPAELKRLRGGQRLALYRVPLKNGEVRRMTLDDPGVWKGTVLGDAYLWHDFYDLRYARHQGVLSHAGIRFEQPPVGRLMASPLDGGPARIVADGLIQDSPVVVLRMPYSGQRRACSQIAGGICTT
jgi:hypothetical protein